MSLSPEHVALEQQRTGLPYHLLAVGVATVALFAACNAPSTSTPDTYHAGGVTYAMPYYVNTDLSVYANIHGMQQSGEYPSLSPELDEVSREPVATWLQESTGDNRGIHDTVQHITTVAETEKRMPVLVAYRIPNRDLGEYSSGGSHDAEDYREYTAAVSAGIGNRPAVVVLEPDALPGVPNMPEKTGEARITMLRDALITYAHNNPQTRVYLDGGHSRWLQPAQLVSLLHRVDNGTGLVHGISLNVSNYRPTQELTDYFKEVNDLYGGTLTALFDTGLNGANPPVPSSAWCNPRGARHAAPTDMIYDPNNSIETVTIRVFGESSGDCKLGDPAAGDFDPALLATELGKPSGHYVEN